MITEKSTLEFFISAYKTFSDKDKTYVAKRLEIPVYKTASKKVKEHTSFKSFVLNEITKNK